MTRWIPAISLAACIISIAILSWYFGPLGFFGASGWTVVTLLAQNYDRALLASSYFLSLFSSFSKRAERRTVVQYLQGTINLSASKINNETKGLLPHTLKVEIVRPTDRETFLKDGQVVVCMESSRNKSRNLARATLFFVADDLVRESRRFIEQTIIRACDFALARKMLMIENRIDAVKCLNEEFLTPETKRDPSLRSYVLAMDEMDLQGTFTRILLREFSDLGAKLSPKLSDSQAELESRTFADKLTLLARKQPGVDVDPTHEGQILRVAVMPVARAEVDSIAPHIKYAKQCFSKKIPILYVLARGPNNIVHAKIVLADSELGNIYQKLTDWDYSVLVDGKSLQCYIAVCTMRTGEVATEIMKKKA